MLIATVVDATEGTFVVIVMEFYDDDTSYKNSWLLEKRFALIDFEVESHLSGDGHEMTLTTVNQQRKQSRN